MLSWPCLWVGVCLVIVCMCVYYEYCCTVERGFCVIRRFVFLYSCQIVVYNHKSFALKTWNVTLSLKTWQLVTSTEILVKLESLWVNCQQNLNDLPLLTSWNFDVMWHKKKRESKKIKNWSDDQSVGLISLLDIRQTWVNDQRFSLNELIISMPSSAWEPQPYTIQRL